MSSSQHKITRHIENFKKSLAKIANRTRHRSDSNDGNQQRRTWKQQSQVIQVFMRKHECND